MSALDSWHVSRVCGAVCRVAAVPDPRSIECFVNFSKVYV